MRFYKFFKIEAYEDEDQKSIIGRSRDEVLEKLWDEDTDRNAFVPHVNYKNSAYTIDLIQASFDRLTDLIEDTYETPQFNETVLKTIPIKPKQKRTYERIIFFQGDEANQYLEMVDEGREDEVINELQNYWSEGHEVYNSSPHGSSDGIYEAKKTKMIFDSSGRSKIILVYRPVG